MQAKCIGSFGWSRSDTLSMQSKFQIQDGRKFLWLFLLWSSHSSPSPSSSFTHLPFHYAVTQSHLLSDKNSCGLICSAVSSIFNSTIKCVTFLKSPSREGLLQSVNRWATKGKGVVATMCSLVYNVFGPPGENSGTCSAHNHHIQTFLLVEQPAAQWYQASPWLVSSTQPCCEFTALVTKPLNYSRASFTNLMFALPGVEKDDDTLISHTLLFSFFPIHFFRPI